MNDELMEIAGRQAGVVTYRQALTAGYSRGQVERLVASRRWIRVRRRSYVTEEAWHEAMQDWRRLHRMRVAAVLLHTPLAAASHQSAALLYDLPSLNGWPVQPAITVPPPTHGTLKPKVTPELNRRVAGLPDDHVLMVGALRYTTPARTLVDLARDLPFLAAVIVADYLLHRELTTLEQVLAVLATMVRWPDRTKAEHVLAFADPRAESVLESLGRAELHLQGVTGGEPQVWLYDADGPIGRVDLYFAEHHTVVEFDGLVKYDGDRSVLRKEKLRQERLEQAGFAVVRITFEEIRFNPRASAHRVWAGFGRADQLWTGPGADRLTGRTGPAPDWARS